MICRILLSAAVVLALACNDSANEAEHNARLKEKTPADSLYAVVDSIHIDAMKRIGSVNVTLGQIKHELDSLVKLPHEKLDIMYQTSLVELQEDLNYANYGMDTWMTEFKADTLKDNPDARIKYLEAELIKAKNMRANIVNGLSKADSILKR